jgi:hypothetical protein
MLRGITILYLLATHTSVPARVIRARKGILKLTKRGTHLTIELLPRSPRGR